MGLITQKAYAKQAEIEGSSSEAKLYSVSFKEQNGN